MMYIIKNKSVQNNCIFAEIIYSEILSVILPVFHIPENGGTTIASGHTQVGVWFR